MALCGRTHPWLKERGVSKRKSNAISRPPACPHPRSLARRDFCLGQKLPRPRAPHRGPCGKAGQRAVEFMMLAHGLRHCLFGERQPACIYKRWRIYPGRSCFGTTYTKIGTIQRRLAWPLRKDDTQIREAFHIFFSNS